MDERIKHLEFIQSVISRLNQNSFQIKGWMVTIVAAFLALYVSSRESLYIIIGVAPTLIFWMLDSYYLQQERKFRGIYNDVAELTPLNERLVVRNFEMPVDKYMCGQYCYIRVLLSKTLAPFYLVVILCLIIAFIILRR